MSRRRIVCGCRRKYGRAVDENIQAAERRFNPEKHVFDGGAISEVGVKCSAITARDLFRFSLTGPVMDRDPRSSAGELERDLSSNPFCRACD